MAGGKLNWQRSEKEERLARYGGVKVDDESIIRDEKLSDTKGTTTDKMVQCPHCSWRVQSLLLNEHLLESHGIVGNPFRCFVSAYREKHPRSLADLFVKDMEERWLARPKDGVLKSMIVELMYRNSNAAKALAAMALTSYLAKQGIDYLVDAESATFCVMSRRPPGRALMSRDFRAVIEWFDTEWEKGRFKKTTAAAIVSPPQRIAEKPVQKPVVTATISRPPVAPPAPKPASNLHREQVAKLMTYQDKPVKGGMKIDIETNANGTFTVRRVVPGFKDLQCANASVEAALAVVERLVR